MKVQTLLKNAWLPNGQLAEIREYGKTLELFTNDEAHKTAEEHYKMATYGDRTVGTFCVEQNRLIVNIVPRKD